MITVTFPTGVRLTYNDVNFIDWNDGERIYLKYKDTNGNFSWRAIVLARSGAVLEWVRPCEVTAAPIPGGCQAVKAALKAIEDREWLDSYDLADLKRALRGFNARSRSWKR